LHWVKYAALLTLLSGIFLHVHLELYRRPAIANRSVSALETVFQDRILQSIRNETRIGFITDIKPENDYEYLTDHSIRKGPDQTTGYMSSFLLVQHLLAPILLTHYTPEDLRRDSENPNYVIYFGRHDLRQPTAESLLRSAAYRAVTKQQYGKYSIQLFKKDTAET